MSETAMEASSQPMIKHYILSLNPTAQHDWDRCTLRNTLTGVRPDLASLIAEAVGEDAGTYLVAVKIEVQVLEKVPIPQSERIPREVPDVAGQRKELIRLKG